MMAILETYFVHFQKPRDEYLIEMNVWNRCMEVMFFVVVLFSVFILNILFFFVSGIFKITF